jgi:hypothetical protein
MQDSRGGGTWLFDWLHGQFFPTEEAPMTSHVVFSRGSQKESFLKDSNGELRTKSQTSGIDVHVLLPTMLGDNVVNVDPRGSWFGTELQVVKLLMGPDVTEDMMSHTGVFWWSFKEELWRSFGETERLPLQEFPPTTQKHHCVVLRGFLL